MAPNTSLSKLWGVLAEKTAGIREGRRRAGQARPLAAMELKVGPGQTVPATMVENSWSRIAPLARRKYIIHGGDTVVIEKTDLRAAR